MIPVEPAIVNALINEEYPDPAGLFATVPTEYQFRADHIMADLGVTPEDIELSNVWIVFYAMFNVLRSE